MKHLIFIFLGLFIAPRLYAEDGGGFANDWAHGYIQSIDTSTELTVLSAYSEFHVGEMLIVQSRDSGQKIIGFIKIESITSTGDGQFILKTRLVRHSKFSMIQVGDTAYRMDVSTFHREYRGTTELVMGNEDPQSSASYKSLVFMGLSSGETAQTLRKNEVLVNILGYLDFGFTSRFTIGSLLPADILSTPNLHGKYKFYESDSNIFSFGMNFFQSPEGSQGVINASLYWDSISSESVITHSNLSLALATFDKAKNLTALKGAGTSSLQTGYEFVMDDWNRVLVGPSFNFESKSVGGYVSYVWIWDHFHALAGLSTTDISKLVYNVRDGYYFNADMYWRF